MRHCRTGSCGQWKANKHVVSITKPAAVGDEQFTFGARPPIASPIDRTLLRP